MAVLNFSGFEAGDNSEAQSGTGTNSIQTSVKRTGSYALRTNPTTTAVGNLRFAKHSTAGQPTTSFSVNSLYSRFYFYIATAPASSDEEFYVVLDTGGSEKCTFRINSSRNIVVYNNAGTLVATGSTALATSTWYRIEIQTSTGAGNTAYEVRIDGTTELSGTMNQLTGQHGSVRLGKGTNRNGQSVDFYYDDALWDDANWPGAGQCKIMLPTANGSTAQWTSGTGASDYQEVDEVPTDADTTYIKCGTGGNQVHLVTLQSTSTAGISASSINAAKAHARVREDTAVTSSNKVRIKSSGTTSDTAGTDHSTSYASRLNLATTDPNTSAAWTSSALDSVEIGVVEVNSVAMRCSTLHMYVDYVPAAASSGQPLLPLLGVG